MQRQGHLALRGDHDQQRVKAIAVQQGQALIGAACCAALIGAMQAIRRQEGAGPTRVQLELIRGPNPSLESSEQVGVVKRR